MWLKHSKTCDKEVSQPDELFFVGLEEKLKVFKHEQKPKFTTTMNDRFNATFPEQEQEEPDHCHIFKPWWIQDGVWCQGEVNKQEQKNGRVLEVSMTGLRLAYYYEDMLHGKC